MPPAAKKISVCKATIKDEKTLKVIPCGLPLVSDGIGGLKCVKRDEHVLKYKTGFCANGDCEGKANKTPSGKAKPSCKWWKRCPCDCHTIYDMMFSQSEMERQVVDNSGYAPDTSEFKMPTLEERIAATASFRAGHADAPRVIESPAPDVAPPTIARSFAPTPTGRAARGELTSWVKKVTDDWAVDHEDHIKCTPVFISETIARNEGLGRAPSVGAVDAVLKRWETVGFAVIDRKPTRFSAYTPDGLKLGLEGCIDRDRRSKKLAAAEAGRGFRR